ncbi:MAG: prolipoprotein diacylglyceryl transferase [Ruminococcaceae bacterium]|nr:prolipoprotein diacylglyceryl transferase [Oscillospiraceae bacterium]
MSTLIQQIEQQGQSQLYYDVIGLSAAVIALIFGIWYGKRLGVSRWKTAVILIAVYVDLAGLEVLLREFVLIPFYKNSGLGLEEMVASIVRQIPSIPLICLLCAKLLHMRWGKVCDVASMFLLLVSALSQPCCIFTGCCHGYEASWGIYSPKTGRYHVPTSFIEMVLTLVIFGWLLYKIAKSGFKSDGTHFPRMLIYYGGMRCICELMRDRAWIIKPFSVLMLYAMFLCVAGIVWLHIVKRKNKNEAANALACENTQYQQNKYEES